MSRDSQNKSAEKGVEKVVDKGVKVSAVTSNRGPPATTVRVEVNAEEIREQIGEFENLEVVAQIPDGGPDAVSWKEESLSKIAGGVSDSGRASGVQKFASTHYGPSGSHELGVGVKLRTESGELRTAEPGERYSATEASKPEETRKIPCPAAAQKDG